jgi:uncharacterized protein YaiE (UPF0345 family)
MLTIHSNTTQKITTYSNYTPKEEHMLTVNSYFDDNVKSIAFQGEQLPATVGVISQGNYTFDTGKNEVLTIVSGSLNVQLPETKEWVTYVAGESF